MAAIYLLINGEQKGPFSLEQVQAMLTAGEITPETAAWREGLTEWTRISAMLTGPSTLPPGMPLPPTPPAKKGMSGWLIALIVVVVLAVLSVPCCCMFGMAWGPVSLGIKKAKQTTVILHAHIIDLAMFSYANDNNNTYPDGATSTEVFQKLLDGGYVTDPAVFYIEMPGKTKATAKHLTAENVCFDVTSGATTSSPGSLPLIFSTGYTVKYEAGASATRDGSTSSPFTGPGRSFKGAVVAYVDNSARFVGTDEEDGTIDDFIPSDFNAGGKTYTQLKP